MPTRRHITGGISALTLLTFIGMQNSAMAAQSMMKRKKKKRPLVIAHRGASGYLPEHTLEGYRHAAQLGADYIEPDLVFTKDGHLIARHDHYLSLSTNVADRKEFADRKTIKTGHEKADWFSEDFTLDEIKSLKCRQTFSGRSREYDDKFTIPTFDEILDLRATLSKETGRPLGIYPETKKPAYFTSIGHDFASILSEKLNVYDLNSVRAPVIIQSFEADILKALRAVTNVQLMQLFDDKSILDEDVLSKVKQYADGIGPFKGLLVNKDLSSSGIVEMAHKLRLFVHPWTFRDDDLPPMIKDSIEEYIFFYKLGVDGVFTDFADTAIEANLIHEKMSN